MDDYQGKKVLVLGLGLNEGGVGSAKFFAKAGAKVRVTDLKSAEDLKPSLDQLKDYPIEYTLGKHKSEDIDWADLIIKNPAIKPGNKYIEHAKQKGKRVEMDMGIFLQFVKPEQLIGITGTKGKSTTSSLIYEVLKNYNDNLVLAGNIGKSVLDAIEYINENTLVVLELSSFQLESFNTHQVSPKYAVITNIYPDHLNYYNSMAEYINAKKIIAKYQRKDDFLFLRKNDPVTTKQDFLENIQSKIIYSSKDDLPNNFHPLLKGEHNLENMAAALAVAQTMQVDLKKALQNIQNFKGMQFRMEFVKIWNGVKIYNDTTATGPDAGIKALETFPNCILICGGMNKNMPYEEYAKTVDDLAKKVFFIQGDSTDEIKRLMKNKEKIIGTYNDLKELLTDVKTEAKEGEVILFSPAATSFNLFQNEFDRGRKFNEAVEKIFKSKP